MALTDKDIVITPNRGQSADPKVEFKGASSTLGPQTISLNVYPTSNGTLSFEGSAGQLFSITNTLTGTIYSVNDVSGIPSIEVLDTGLVKLAQYSGNVLVGTGTDDGSKLQVRGSLRVGNGGWNSSPAGTTFSHTIAANTGNFRTVNFDGNGSIPSVWWTSGSRPYGAIDAQDPGLTFWAHNGSGWQKQITMGYGTVNIDTALQQGGNQVLHAGNYNSYAPTLTGGNASGTWGINITGSAATATDSTKLPLTGGTITGTIRIDGGGSQPLTISTSSSSPWAFGLIRTDTGADSKIFLHNPGSGSAWIFEHIPYFYNGGNYNVPLHNGNYTSYSPPYSGGVLTGTWYFQSNLGNTSGATSNPPLQAFATGGNSAFMSFHRSGNYAVNFGLDSDNVLRIGGWSASTNRWQLDMDGNNTIPGRLTANAWTTYARNYSHEWIEFPNYSGLYSPQNNAHFYPNNATYGSWRIAGTRNGWYGIYFDSGSTLMMNSDTVGFYRADYGWQMRWAAGTGYINKGNPGGGTEATILDSSNYTNYSHSISTSDSRYHRKDTTSQWVKPYYEYGNYLTTETPQSLVSQMGGGGLRVDFMHPSYTGSGGWNHVITWSGYNLYNMYQLGGNYDGGTGTDLWVRSEANHGGTAWTAWRRLLNSSNYNSYSPTLTGGGASGTWSINITGSASYATTAGSADQIDGWGFRNTGSNSSVNANDVDSNGITYYTAGVDNFSGNSTDGALYSQYYSSSWQHQIAGDYRSGQIAVRGKNSGTWQPWRTIYDTSNLNVNTLPYIQRIDGNSGSYDLNIGNVVHAWVRFSQGAWTNGPYPGNYSHVLSFNTSTVDNRTFQIYGGDVPGHMYVRPNQGGTWHPWERVLTSNNYNSYSPTLTGGNASGTWSINITGSAATATDSTKVPLSGGTMTGTLFINSKLRVNNASGPSDSTYGTAADIPMHMSGNTRTQTTFLIENTVNSSIDYPVIVIRRTPTPVGSRFGGMIRFADKNSSGTEISSQIYSFNRLTSQDLFLDAGSGTEDRVVLRAGSSSSMQVAENFIMNVKAAIYAVTTPAALDIDCKQSNYFTKTINGDSTFTFSNVPAPSGFTIAYSFTLELTHTSGTVTWPASVRWPGNVLPSLTTGKTHLFMFVTDDGGSRWRGSFLSNYDN